MVQDQANEVGTLHRVMRARPIALGLQAATVGLFLSATSGGIAAIVTIPKWIAVSLLAPAVQEAVRAFAVKKFQPHLLSPRNWFWFGAGYGLIEMFGQMLISGIRDGAMADANRLSLSFLLQVLLSVVVCATLRVGAPIVVAIALALAIIVVHRAIDPGFALHMLLYVFLIAGTLKWGERLEEKAPLPGHRSNPVNR